MRGRGEDGSSDERLAWVGGVVEEGVGPAGALDSGLREVGGEVGRVRMLDLELAGRLEIDS